MRSVSEVGFVAGVQLERKTGVAASGPFTSRACVACQSSLSDVPYFRSSSIVLFRCDGCDSLTALPRPTPDQQGELHDNADYFDHPYFLGRRELTETVRYRCRRMFDRVEAAIGRQKLRGQSHLDIGCDTGTFLLAAAEEVGTKPVGIDVAQRSVVEASRRGVDAYCGALETLSERLGRFHLITAIDVVEHVVDPGSLLQEIAKHLNPGGVCYLETPNVESLVYRAGKALASMTANHPEWVFDRLFPAEHIQYFSEVGLRSLIEKAGLEVVDVSSRRLPVADISASIPVRIATAALQIFDAGSHRKILHCVVARRPGP